MWGVLLVPSSLPTFWPIYDGVDVNVTSNVTWFHLNHDMVSRRIYKLSFYGGHSITIYSFMHIIQYHHYHVPILLQHQRCVHTYIRNDYFFRGWQGFGQYIFRSRPQYGISKLEFLGQIASFERRLRGAAPTPLARAYPFRTST